MADDSAEEKTEEPTSKRREEFREQGSVAKSQDLSALLAIVGGLAGFALLGGRLIRQIMDALRAVFQIHGDTLVGSLTFWLYKYVAPVAWTMFFFLMILFFGVLVVNLAQTGGLVSLKAMSPKFDTLNPMKGLKKLLSVQTLVTLVKNLAKTLVMGMIVYSTLRARLDEIVVVSALPFVEAFRWAAVLIATITFRIAIFLTVLALMDYLYQWYSLQQKMKMGRQEIREEIKQQELSPHVKAQVKKVARERSKRTIHKEVPTADVIVTNPTHYSIALRYDRLKDPAPRVVAKGKDLLAKLIRDLASEHDIPLYEYPELARGLYKKVRIGQIISVEYYESVAQVLAYIYRVYRRHRVTTGRAEHAL